jgi:penicillin-insensitive murein endopeptidase
MKTNKKSKYAFIVYMALVFGARVASAETQTELEERIGPWLELREGGIAHGAAHQSGRLENATLLPDEGEGFIRYNSADTSWGAGHMISLLQGASKEYNKNYDSDTIVHVGSIAMRHGGPYRPHSSHQNGLDADLLYMGMTTWDTVLDERGAVSELYNQQKNWDYFKLLFGQKIVEEGKIKSVISMILVGPEIKSAICRWAKQNNLTSDPENRALLSSIVPTAGHSDHFHIRLRCSPYHSECRKQNVSPRPCP